ATVAGLLPFASLSIGQNLELRGTLAKPVTDSIETGAVGTIAYDPISPGALPFEDELDIDPYAAFGGGEIFADELEEAPARPPALSDSGLGARGNPRAGPVSDRQSQRMNPRIQAIQGSSLRRDDNPYAPVGFRIGTFNLFPTVEQGLTATSNATNSPDGEEALLSETRLQLRGNSDWSRHRLDF